MLFDYVIEILNYSFMKNMNGRNRNMIQDQKFPWNFEVCMYKVVTWLIVHA